MSETNSELAQLADLSRRLGEQKAYAQGGGGNTSLKDTDRRMWIKASGVELATAQPATGFVPVDFPAVKTGIPDCKTEADYVALVNGAKIAAEATNDRRPSIETGFHALLGRVVMHSHSVWGNLLNCAEQGAAILKQLLPDALWIPYITPGLPLTKRVQKYLAAAPDAQILFLQNHGVIVSADDTETAWAIHEDINQRIRRHFKLDPGYNPPDVSGDADTKHMLFPDQAVYLGHETLRNSKAGSETGQAYAYLRATMQQVGLTPHFLPASEAETLLNMEAEKYRQKVAQA